MFEVFIMYIFKKYEWMLTIYYYRIQIMMYGVWGHSYI